MIDMYTQLRARFGVMDAIRMTARRYGMAPIDLAAVLGLSTYFITHR
jgi:hypothetical protein